MTLFVLAAGMGSRFAKGATDPSNSDKAIARVTEHGEYLIDFSVYDAIRAGFNRIVFVIKSRDYEVFHSSIGKRVADAEVEGKKAVVEYVFQDLHTFVPDEKLPAGREKPFGTTHAILCAKGVLYDGFAVINADDFYGTDAYKKAAEFLSNADVKDSKYCMVGYKLGNTLSDNGSVNRGECMVDEKGNLYDVVERLDLAKAEGGAYYDNDIGNADKYLTNDTIVSMNMWCFTPTVFEGLNKDFEEFLEIKENPLKKECLLPNTIGKMIKSGECEVKVLTTDSHWFGMTFYEDLAKVKKSLKDLTAEGVYPENLWAKK